HDADDDQRRDREQQHHHQGFDVIAEPGDDDIARTIGKPDEAGGDQRDGDKEEDNLDHAALTPFRARASCWWRNRARRRAPSAAPWRASTSWPRPDAPLPAACRYR